MFQVFCFVRSLRRLTFAGSSVMLKQIRLPEGEVSHGIFPQKAHRSACGADRSAVSGFGVRGGCGSAVQLRQPQGQGIPERCQLCAGLHHHLHRSRAPCPLRPAGQVRRHHRQSDRPVHPPGGAASAVPDGHQHRQRCPSDPDVHQRGRDPLRRRTAVQQAAQHGCSRVSSWPPCWG